jgi:sigma-B regulation protein RsbQ
MLFAHGYGCDQNMWRFVEPAFRETHRTIVFDHVGAGGADPTAYDRRRHGSLDGYAADIVELCDDLHVRDGVFVGHSVSAMLGVLAAAGRPELFEELILIGPSPRYLDDDGDGYIGGFGREDIDGMLASLEANFLGWSHSMAPVIMGSPDRPELGDELAGSFCRMDPEIARRFAEVTFLSDNRTDLARVKTPALVLQCRDDVIAPAEVGEYVHAALAHSTLDTLDATGHCPNLSAPEETVAAIRAYLGR